LNTFPSKPAAHQIKNFKKVSQILIGSPFFLLRVSLFNSMMKKQAFYFPLSNGVYEVGPGLHPFGADFGNGRADQCLFQIDETFEKYHQAKIHARTGDLKKYYLSDGMASPRINAFILERLLSEWPEYFSISDLQENDRILFCHLTGDRLIFDGKMNLIGQETKTRPPYVDAFDALTSQVQEDLTVWRLDRTANREWLSFAEVHTPVADFEKMRKASRAIVEAIVTKGPYVRFVWGVATDHRLNHHPVASTGRQFSPVRPVLYLRVERQTLWPFPDESASLFSIRTYFVDR